MVSKNSTTIKGSTIGAVSTGDFSQAHGTVTTTSPISQAEYEHVIQEAQAALLRDRDKADPIDAIAYERFGEILRALGKLHMKQASLAEQVEMMKSSVDELAAESVAKKVRGRGLAGGLEVAKALGTHVVTGVIVDLLRS